MSPHKYPLVTGELGLETTT